MTELWQGSEWCYPGKDRDMYCAGCRLPFEESRLERLEAVVKAAREVSRIISPKGNFWEFHKLNAALRALDKESP